MKNNSDATLHCRNCGESFELNAPIWKCVCGGLLDIQSTIQTEVGFDGRRGTSLWRYRDVICISAGAAEVSLGEGFTPILPVQIGGRDIWVKQDQIFPTGSYKDRGASVLISQAKAIGIRKVVEDSSGNAGCAIAAYCAQAEIACEIYVPASTSPGKLAQIERYGAVLHKIPGSREDTAAAVMEAAEKDYYASHSWNPFFFQGTKTFAYEVFEQLGGKVPDHLVLPAGNGTLLLGAAMGFRELRSSGMINRIPKIVAVQTAACAPLAHAFEQGLTGNAKILQTETIAEGIAIANPVRGAQIIEEVKASGGLFLTVTECEIHDALLAMCKMGFYIEPTSAATIAGVVKYVTAVPSEETIVSVFSGHGLKATEKMLKL